MPILTGVKTALLFCSVKTPSVSLRVCPGGGSSEVRVAWWMVAWTLRNLGRAAQALEIQQRLRSELDAVGEEDPYVDEELALLTAPPPDADSRGR